MEESLRNNEKKYRLPIRRPVTTAMIFLTLVVFGWKSYQELPINLMPDISYPTLTVRTEFEGAAPEDVEKLLTRPLEETLSIVGGLVEISSTSSAGLSEIVMEFAWGTDMSMAQQDVRDRLDLFDPPAEVTEKPVILRYDPTLDPVLRVAIRGNDYSHILDPAERAEEERRELLTIREAAEEELKSDLEGEPGIAQLLVKGGREQEIQILLDTQLLKNLGLTPEGVSSQVRQQNVSLSGGKLQEGSSLYLVRTLNEYESLEEISKTVVGGAGDAQIRLEDVATVRMGEKERETIVRIDGVEAVELEIYKWGDANTVQICNRLKDLFEFEREPTVLERITEKLKDLMPEAEPPAKDMPAELAMYRTAQEIREASTLRSRLPDYAELTLVSDQSRFIVAAISEVQNTAIMGGVLALIILYFFLRDLRSTLIIGVSIPISVIATFIPMFMRDVTLNIMSLGGLALGVGMLVDNSIVVLESIFRCKEEGDDTVDAANRGTQEVASAVTASTLTTIAVFLPLAFVEGVAGQLFRDQALTVTFALIASLLVALYLIPMVSSRQRLALLADREVIWLLRGFREARASYGPLMSAVMVVPNGVRYSAHWLCESAGSTFGPTFAGIGRLVSALRDRTWLRAMARLLLVLFAVAFLVVVGVYVGVSFWKGQGWGFSVALIVMLVFLSAPFLVLAGAVLLPLALVTVLFFMHVLLRVALVIIVTFLFVLSVVVMAVYWALARVLNALLWLPLQAFDVCFSAFRSGYLVVLRQSLRFSPVILALTLALSVHAAFVGMRLGRELIPPLKQGEFGIRMDAPPGTQLEETAERARLVETAVLDVEEVGTVTVEIGEEKSKAEQSRGENVAEFTVLLANPKRDAARQDQIIDRLRRKVSQMTSDEVTFTLPTLFSFNTAVELQVRGDDTEVLEEVGRQALREVAAIPGLKDAELSIKKGYPEVIIELDRDLCASYGIQPDQVANRLRTEVYGEVPTEFDQEGTKIDIRVRTDRRRLQNLHDLRTLSVKEGHPPLPLNAVAHITVKEGPSEIRRIDQRQVAVITANVEGRDLGSVAADIEARIAQVEKPPDYRFVLGGQNRELQTSLNSLQFALMLAVFLVYVVMACQFESVWQPGIVMGAVPLAFIGVIYVLDGLAIDLSIVVYIGGIILAGIVVNDAIVLVDYINQLRARGYDKREAVVQAGNVRLRPILMTTLTTVLGLVPMALWQGEGAEIRQPMAITVMAGLTSATVLTLVIIPMIYDLFVRDTKEAAPGNAAPENTSSGDGGEADPASS